MPSSNAGETELLSVDEALERILSGLGPSELQRVPIHDAAGRILAESVKARFSLPARPVSAMDGYAVRADDCAKPGARLECIGESAAGTPWGGSVAAGQCTRIFTGAILPDGTDAIAIQEDVDASPDDGDAAVTVREPVGAGDFVRPAGLDIDEGQTVARAGSTLSARVLAFAAAAGHDMLKVWRRPVIGILSTGDELLPPGGTPEPGQIIASNAVYLAQIARNSGATPVDLGIAGDRPGAVLGHVRASSSKLDMIVTTGGASVGAHDHVASDLESGGASLDFWKIAMRPGKPLVHGYIDETPLLGLPGNPVSSAVCANIFVRPAIAKLAGGKYKPRMIRARLDVSLPENDRRQDYLRARLAYDGTGEVTVATAPKQDSSMMSVFAGANALVVRPPHDKAQSKGDYVMVISLDSWA